MIIHPWAFIKHACPEVAEGMAAGDGLGVEGGDGSLGGPSRNAAYAEIMLKPSNRLKSF